MRRLLLVITGLAMILGTGYAAGLRTHRWGKAEALSVAVGRLQAIPTSFGSWDSSATEIPDDQLRVAEAEGSFSRQFVNRETGQRMDVMILCGSHGPISVHPPTVCFLSAGWQMPAPEIRRTLEAVDGSAAHFWVGNFNRIQDGVPQTVRTWWTWSQGRGWQAPERPRISFAGSPFLYKMYVTTALADADVSPEEDPTAAFLDELLPHLTAALDEADSDR